MECPVNLYLFTVAREWFSVAGLGLDIAGVLILVWELNFSRATEAMSARFSEQVEDARPPERRRSVSGLAGFDEPTGYNFISDREQRYADERRGIDDFRYEVFKRRGSLVHWGAGLLMLGFGLQIIGAWPC